MIVDCVHYRDGRPEPLEEVDLRKAAAIAQSRDAGGFIWLGLSEPDPSELAEMQQLFELSELAVEDTQSFHLRPKIEVYDEPRVLFAVVRAARYDDEHEEVRFGEVSIFVAERFAITVRQGGVPELAVARRRLERRPDLIRHGSSSVLWAVLDKLVDDYAPVVAGLEQDVDEIEQTVFGGFPAATERIYRLRGEATGFYRAIHPLLGPIESLQRGIYTEIADEMIPFFRDVNDHLKLVDEEVYGQRETLAAVLQANMAVISLAQNELAVRQNDAMKLLTIVATVFLPLTFITGFFGMNFGWMVSRIDQLWAFAALGLGSMVVSCIGLMIWFRRAGLLGGKEG